jgi:hypothetical protein
MSITASSATDSVVGRESQSRAAEVTKDDVDRAFVFGGPGQAETILNLREPVQPVVQSDRNEVEQVEEKIISGTATHLVDHVLPGAGIAIDAIEVLNDALTANDAPLPFCRPSSQNHTKPRRRWRRRGDPGEEQQL